ncbi:hypothetical protein WICPIJ_006021 [Wickerhamomyces pijperi]|uniref:DNA-directed RNA polymerase I subunit RPA12 n=1 Tax=Wickerhamomyces pijperi TaxID=599730 RepID=A0A9P8Q305_WICPI|nr:hypothetical protein WICPIJ_006021 [Wickerhamomyces pijperi]
MSVVGSLIFCLDCGNLLDQFANHKSINCGSCNKEYLSKDFANLKVVTRSADDAFPSALKLKQSVVKTTLKTDELEEGATIKEKCPQCGNEEMQYHTLQLRSADEGATVFYTSSLTSNDSFWNGISKEIFTKFSNKKVEIPSIFNPIPYLSFSSLTASLPNTVVKRPKQLKDNLVTCKSLKSREDSNKLCRIIGKLDLLVSVINKLETWLTFKLISKLVKAFFKETFSLTTSGINSYTLFSPLSSNIWKILADRGVNRSFKSW